MLIGASAMKKKERYSIYQKIKYATCDIDKLFLGIIFLNLIGSISFLKETESTIIISVLWGLMGYLLGYKINSQKRSINMQKNKTRMVINAKTRDDSKVELCALSILFIILFLLGFSLFIERGIPLFNSFDNEMRSSFGDGTKGRIRALTTGLPMVSIYFFLLNQKNGKGKKGFIFVSLISLIGLAFYSYKAYILWFVIVMFYTYYYISKNAGRDIKVFKWILIACFIVVCLVSLFALWLDGNDTALTAFFKRIMYDQLDGFNYIHQKYVPEYGYLHGDFMISELKNIIFTADTNGYTFTERLAELFYGRKVTWGIVITIYGCFYIDFGDLGVFIGLAIFGFGLKSISNYLDNMCNKRNINIVCVLMLITFMGYIFQNGSIINELRGTFLSIILFKILYEIILLMCRIAFDKLSL